MSKIILNCFFNILVGIDKFLKIFGKNTFLQQINDFVNRKNYLEIQLNQNKIKFFVPNKLTHYRTKTILSKEPETIKWIENFEKTSDKKIIFWDIGANIGLYSIYAANYHKDINIFSFEASTSNLRCLSRNISINNFQKNINICQLPLTNKKNMFLEMKEDQFVEGGAISTFGENFDYKGNEILTPGNNYYIFGTTINSLIENNIIQVPNYIKIDVDGIEHLILQGADKYLNHKDLKGISVELNKDFKEQYEKSFKILKENGFHEISTDNFKSIINSKDGTKNYHFKKNKDFNI